jgi:hypothetical protein
MPQPFDQTQYLHGMDTDENGYPIPKVKPMNTDIMPIDIQSRLATTIQTHNAVSVATVSSSQSSWIDTDGFTDIAVSLLNDASFSCYVDIQWSSDGSTYQGLDSGVISGTLTRKSASVPTKMRYARIVAGNNDTVSHTMSSFAYLKA